MTMHPVERILQAVTDLDDTFDGERFESSLDEGEFSVIEGPTNNVVYVDDGETVSRVEVTEHGESTR